jgi:triacylglycerol lipase
VSHEAEAVVLLHGMGRSWLSMALLGHRLKRMGYETRLFGYSPRKATLDELSRDLREFIEDRVAAPVYHLVGHSLGNIIIRNGFRGSYRPELRRIVMLAPPNGPASLASSLRENRLYRGWTGDSGHGVGFDEPNDGVVRVANTKLAGMKDWTVVHHTHTLIMLAQDTAELCARFLEQGEFGQVSEEMPSQAGSPTI